MIRHLERKHFEGCFDKTDLLERQQRYACQAEEPKEASRSRTALGLAKLETSSDKHLTVVIDVALHTGRGRVWMHVKFASDKTGAEVYRA